MASLILSGSEPANKAGTLLIMKEEGPNFSASNPISIICGNIGSNAVASLFDNSRDMGFNNSCFPILENWA